MKEHPNDGITLKELKEKYGISNDRIKYMITLYKRHGKETLSLTKGHKEDNETIIKTDIRECYEETNIIFSKDDLIKELTSYSYEFLTPSNKLIRKTIVPFLFEVKEEC